MINEVRGAAMTRLTDGLPSDTVAAIKRAESVLCIIFKYQTVYGTERCFRLRKALVDLVTATSEQEARP